MVVKQMCCQVTNQTDRLTSRCKGNLSNLAQWAWISRLELCLTAKMSVVSLICFGGVHGRSRELSKAAATQGGVAVFEQPPSSMAWLEPENFQCLKTFQGHVAWVDACQHNMPFAKSWCFACNNPCIQHVAARCNYPTRHASIAGVRNNS